MLLGSPQASGFCLWVRKQYEQHLTCWSLSSLKSQSSGIHLEDWILFSPEPVQFFWHSQLILILCRPENITYRKNTSSLILLWMEFVEVSPLHVKGERLEWKRFIIQMCLMLVCLYDMDLLYFESLLFSRALSCF